MATDNGTIAAHSNVCLRVKAFMEAGGQTTDRFNAEQANLYAGLIEEEMQETDIAIEQRDAVGTADGIADTIVVLIGWAYSFGLPLHEVMDFVLYANDSKVDPVTGKVRYNEAGKIMKPDNFVPPDVRIRELFIAQGILPRM